MKLLLIISAFLFQTGLLAAQYNSKALKTKDYEEMRDLLNGYIKNSQSHTSDDEEDIDAAVSELKKGLRVLFMRPDTDAIRTSLLVILQSETTKYRSFMNVLQEVIEETLEEFKSGKGSVAYQVSLLYIVENSLSYLQAVNNKESNSILNKVKQADLKFSKEMSNYLLLELGRGTTASPSYIAGNILNSRKKELKRKKAKRAKVLKKKKRQPSAVKVKKHKEDAFKSDLQIDL